MIELKKTYVAVTHVKEKKPYKIDLHKYPKVNIKKKK